MGESGRPLAAAAPAGVPERIDPLAHIAAVHLAVADLERVASFYTGALGLDTVHQAPGTVALGAGGDAWLLLRERRGARRAGVTTGLYHVAILTPSRRDLADALARLLAAGARLDGASDHGVSEALYLADPEQNGIEIYRDRPREEWPVENSRLRMENLPFDLDRLLGERGAGARVPSLVPAATRIGHIHLRVAGLDDAERFYVGVLGFDLVARLGHSAMFVSAGGYHHHIGLNTWGTRGAPGPPPGAPGLDRFVVGLSGETERDRVIARVHAAGVAVTGTEDGPMFEDPFTNRIVLAIGPRPISRQTEP